MKKIAAMVGGIIVLFLAAIIIIPLVVDVDQYRPQILKAANEQINGHLDLGKLKMDLWGKVHIKVDGLTLTDSQKRNVVSVKDASFDLPYTSLLSGSPLITLKMVNPQMLVVKNKDGKLNVMSLMKSASKESAPTATAAGGGTAGGSKKVELPNMALNARVGLFIENAKLVYRDEAKNLVSNIDQLNLRVKNLSLTSSTDIEMWADLKTTMDDLKLEGPLKFSAEIDPDVSGGEFKSAKVEASFNADDLSIDQGTLFHKKKGVPANFKFKGSLTQENLNLKEAALKFHNADIVVKGDYHQTNGANLTFNAKPIDLGSWSSLIPMLAEYDLDGTLTVNGNMRGQSDALQYSGKLNLKDVTLKGPNLKAKPVINADLVLATDRVESISIELQGPGNELHVKGKSVSFDKPQLTFSITSPKGLDLDQWIEFPKDEAKPVAKASGGAGSAAGGAAVDNNASAAAVRKNSVLANMIADGSVSIPFIKAKGSKFSEISAKIQMKNLVAGITNFKMKMFDGAMVGGFTTDLKPKTPTYSMNLSVTGFDMQKAVESQFKSFKNTLIGKLSATMTGSGASFNTEEAKANLQMKGNFKMANATFKTIDVARMANAAISDSIGKISSKVPALSGKKVEVPADRTSKYEMVSSDFTISGGYLNAPNFVAKAVKNGGLDLKGSTKMGLIDESLDAKWEITDTYRQTNAHILNVNVGNRMVNNVLAKGENDPVTFPISVGCKWSNPCVNYAGVPEYLAGIAANRVGKAAVEEAKSKAGNAIQDAVKGAIGGGKNPLKGLFGR